MNTLIQRFTFHIVQIVLILSFYITDWQVRLSRSDTMNMRVQDSIKWAYKTLTDSNIQYDFGTRCYYTGVPPEGRIAIKELQETQNTDLIKKVLHGHNHEGKIYAIEALLEMNRADELKLSVQDKEQIKSIINKDFEVNRCQGGIVSTLKSDELFKEEKFKKLLEINRIQL